MLIDTSFHLSYCTNVHPGESWEETFRQLRYYLPAVKKRVSPHAPMGVGLRLGDRASTELGLDNELLTFMNWLADEELYVFTMNGFSYGNFHQGEIKDLVHAPDWTTGDRLEYTIRLFKQLVNLLPEGMEGGISTSPLSYKYWHGTEEIRDRTFKRAAFHLSKLIVFLYRAECETGKYMHLDLEPEPDGLLENSEQTVNFFREYLLPVAGDYLLRNLGKSRLESEELVFRYINICYDVCHFALAYESPSESFKRFEQTGIRIGKIQLSSALKVVMTEEDREAKLKELQVFDESVYLHQVTELREGVVFTYPDLPEVLGRKRKFKELRAHFHVPVYLKKIGNLDTTRDALTQVLDYLTSHEHLCHHLEVETYTWNVAPQLVPYNLERSIARELLWVCHQMKGIHEENSRA